jgi:hypothetical protein
VFIFWPFIPRVRTHPKRKPKKKRNVVLDSCERSFTSQSRIPAKQQRFHSIDVHASWKCSSMILRGRAGVELGTGEGVIEGVARQ